MLEILGCIWGVFILGWSIWMVYVIVRVGICDWKNRQGGGNRSY